MQRSWHLITGSIALVLFSAIYSQQLNAAEPISPANRGEALLAKGDFHSAAFELEQVVKSHPNNFAVYSALLNRECTEFARDFIDRCLATNQFVKAEIAARYMVWVGHHDHFIPENLQLREPLLGTMSNLQTRFAAIDNDMRKPKEKFPQRDTPLIME